MKKLTLPLLIICLLSVPSLAQEISTKAEKQKIIQDEYDGFSTVVVGQNAVVRGFLLKYLRESGRVKDRKNYVEINKLNINGNLYENEMFLAQVRQDGQKQKVWMGFKTEGVEAGRIKSMKSNLQKYLRSYVVAFYRNEAQKEIDESERAVKFSSRKYDKLLIGGTDLKSDLEGAQQEQLRLEKSLEEIKLEIESLKLKIEQNKVSQDSSLVELDKLKKILQGQKTKYKKIN